MNSLKIGDIIEFRCQTWHVRGCDGVEMQLKCLDDGGTLVLPVGVVLSDDTFVGPHDSGPSIADQRLLDLLSADRRREAEFWYAHMHEVKYGISLHDRAIAAPVEATATVEARLADKRRALAALGIKVSMATMWRRWRGFNQRGVIGCADHRGLPGHVRQPIVELKVINAIAAVKLHFAERSTPSKKQIIELVGQKLRDENIAVPSRSSMYELLDRFDRGEHTTGEATSRRSYGNSPDRAFGTIEAIFPGEEVQLDSTPLDAMVLMADGTIGPVDLAAGIDVVTRTITADIVRPNAAKSVDAIELLANSCVPQQMLPGWLQRMAIARDYLPDVISSEPVLAANLANKPMIDVRGVVTDRGKIFVSDAFLRTVEMRGINHRVAPPYSPTAKPHIERLFKTIGDDFVRWIPGYTGRSVSHRGRHPEKDAVWPLPLLQALLDEWIITVYQNRRPHKGLVNTFAPRMPLSPNQIYRAYSESAPTPIRTLTRDEWISMHPVVFRRINRDGINAFNLHYDTKDPRFHDMRRTKSPNKKQKGKWEVRYDPDNLMQVWLRDERAAFDEHGRQIVQDNGWIECRWVLAKQASIPFGIDVVHAIVRQMSDRVTDKRVLDRAEQIHRRLLAGPAASDRKMTPAERRAARSNITRQELTGLQPQEDPRDLPLPQRTFRTDPTQNVSIEPMRALRLSEGW